MIQPQKNTLTALLTASALALSFFTSPTYAAGGKVSSPTGTAPDRYVYYPGTEALEKDEIRLFACGTGLPAARRDQAATCPQCCQITPVVGVQVGNEYLV